MFTDTGDVYRGAAEVYIACGGKHFVMFPTLLVDIVIVPYVLLVYV